MKVENMLKKSFEEFQSDFIALHNTYKELHQKLNAYRGKEIGDKVAEVNELISEIQKIYYELYPSISFISHNFAIVRPLVHDFEKFVEDLKNAGATKI